MELLSAIPALPVRDVGNAAAFYRDRLGFHPRHGEPGFAVLRRDAVEVHLWAADDPDRPGAEPHLAGSGGCRIRVRGLRALYASCQDAGIVHPNGTLASRPWGEDDFTVLDAHGNAVAFCEPAAG